jgi:16S rRNA (uracil1498-N3)-methyltransferase
VWLVVGPEGGISDAELAALTVAGAIAVRLGPHVLRSSSAGPAAMAALAALRGTWSA